MFSRPRFDAVVFDLDGSIVDTEQAVHLAWTEVFEEHDCAFSLEEWCVGVGTTGGFDPYAALDERSQRPAPARDALREQVARRQEELLREVPVRPGVLDWLLAAERLELAIAVASSSSDDWVLRRLAGLGLSERFPVIVTPTSGLPPKPAPDLYLEACRRLKVSPERALAVEDSPNGIAAATAAGLTCIAVPNGITAGLDLSRAHLLLGSLAERSLEDLVLGHGNPVGAGQD
ncbi:MAG: family hydrolase [Acidimicrobiaceae bacterium]|nr:family hydrolase [Acidimicrobiaceae bacterium]